MTFEEMKSLYNEIEQAEATGRVLDGSSDHGYDEEYIGYGEMQGKPVKAVYLIDYNEHDGSEDPDFWDWELALKRFEEI